MRLLFLLPFALLATPAAAQTATGGGSPQTVSVCFVDAGRLTEARAAYDASTGTATLVHGGQEVSVDYARYRGTHVGGPYAAGAPWLVEGAPITVNNRRYVKYGLARVLGVTELTAVGQYRGVTVFAEAGAVSPEVVYVPVQMFCEFQPYALDAARR